MSNLDRYLNKIICGDCLELMKELPDESIDCCVCSPPYWGLRDYGHHNTIWDGDLACEHKWDRTSSFKRTGGHGVQDSNTASHFEISTNCCTKCGAWEGSLGLEPTFKLYIQHLLDIFKEVKRVLKKTGTCWVNIGDTYSGSNCGKGDYRENKSLQKDIYNKISPQSLSSRFSKWRRDGEGGELDNTMTRIDTGIPIKSLIGIPERFTLAMTDELDFIRRNTIIWHKPNCMPASVSDRFTVNFEYLYFFTKTSKYYFEQSFEPLKDVSIARLNRGVSEQNKWVNSADGQSPHNLSKPRLNIKHRKMEGTKYGGDGKGLHDHSGYFSADGTPRFYPQGRNKRCVWTITTKGFPNAHFATFPEELIETPIKAGCPEFICKECGKAREKIFETDNPKGITGRAGKPMVTNGVVDTYDSKQRCEPGHNSTVYSSAKFKGYTDCGCNVGYEGGIVLDPFCGSGTSALVALKLNRNFIGFEISQKYVDMANKRLKPYRAQGKLKLETTTSSISGAFNKG